MLQHVMYNIQLLSLFLFASFADLSIFCCGSTANPLQSGQAFGLATITSSQGGICQKRFGPRFLLPEWLPVLLLGVLASQLH